MAKARRKAERRLTTLKARNLDRNKGRRISADAVRGGAVRSVIESVGVKYTM
jgi:hypothetical protein